VADLLETFTPDAKFRGAT